MHICSVDPLKGVACWVAQPICIKVPKVVGKNECEVVAVGTFKLSHPADEIKRITKDVEVTKVTVGLGKALVNGIVRKNVEFERTDHLIGSDKFKLPFECCIDVPGAQPGDDFQVERATVVVEEDELFNDDKDHHDKDCDDDKDHGKKFLFEKVCVRVTLKVLRLVQITVQAEEPGLCP